MENKEVAARDLANFFYALFHLISFKAPQNLKAVEEK